MANYKVDINSIILHYLQENISEEETRILMKWLQENEENKTLFFQTKEIYDLQKKGLYPTEKEIQDSKERLLSKLKKLQDDKEKKYYPTKVKRFQLYFFKYIATAIIAIGVTLGIQYLLTTDEKIVYTELNIESGPRMGYIILPDSTKVFLNASTKIRFPNKFEEKTREVFLDGEAYFDVVNNEQQPFIVQTSKQRIRVLGTKFNVMDYSTDDYAITTLVSGEIDLATTDETGTFSAPITLQPDQQVFYSRANKHVALSNIKTDMNRTWVNKIYHFKNEPLKQIVSRLEKLYGIKINILNKTLENTEFTGTFKLGQELEEVLRIINFEMLFTYEVTENEILIK